MKPLRLIHLVITVAALVLPTLLGASTAGAATATDNGAIAAKYAAVGGVSGYLGQAVTPLRCGLAQGGCYRKYTGGSIYWSHGTGAHTVHGGIGARWASFHWEAGFLGYPLDDEDCRLVARGCVQRFQGGLIYWQVSAGAHAMHGGILDKYAQMGYENSPLGFPRTDESCVGTSVRNCSQSFLGGAISWRTGKGTSVTPSSGSIGVVINKQRPNSPITRTPPDLVPIGSQYMRREAANALQRLFNAASSQGVGMTTVSGFRSYSTQASLYNQYVAQYGQAAVDTFSARPGYSEHQSGLAMDVGNPNGACSLNACFASTPAGVFVSNNAWRYGFIVRYPNGYAGVTGYAYEPWHLRYVGVYVSTAMHNLGYRTLEQFFGLPAAPHY